MEPEDTIDYNIRKTWYNITKLYNRTANEYMASMALGMKRGLITVQLLMMLNGRKL